MVIQMPLSDVPEGCRVYCPTISKNTSARVDTQRDSCTWVRFGFEDKLISGSKSIVCYVDEEEFKEHVCWML